MEEGNLIVNNVTYLQSVLMSAFCLQLRGTSRGLVMNWRGLKISVLSASSSLYREVVKLRVTCK